MRAPVMWRHPTMSQPYRAGLPGHRRRKQCEERRTGVHQGDGVTAQAEFALDHIFEGRLRALAHTSELYPAAATLDLDLHGRMYLPERAPCLAELIRMLRIEHKPPRDSDVLSD